MHLREYLADRIGYISAYCLGLAAVGAVIYLDVYFATGKFIEPANLFYAAALALIILVLFLLFDFTRLKPFYQQVERLVESGQSLDSFVSLQAPRSQEQHLYLQQLKKLNRLYLDDMVNYRDQHQDHLAFVHQWVHHMKTPVSVIQLILQQDNDSDQLVDPALQSIREEMDKLAHGLEMALHHARLNAFSNDFVVQRTNLTELVRDVINHHKKSWIGKQIYPKLDSETESVWVETDGKWIRLLIEQLTTNAIKYSRPDPAQLHIDEELGRKQVAYKITEQNGQVTLSISDQGVGIPARDIDRVFDAFFTGDNGRKYPGSTGLGMFLVRLIATRLDIRLAIHSQPGEGTTVSITFPLRDSYFETIMTKM